MLQRYFFAGCAPLPTNGYSLLHHYHLLGSFVSKNNFEYKMFVLQHFFCLYFLPSENLQRVLEHFTKKHPETVTTRATNCPEQHSQLPQAIRNVPRAMEAIAPSSWMNCPEQFVALQAS